MPGLSTSATCAARDHHPGGNPTGQGLGAGQDVGLGSNAELLIGEPVPGSPHAGLNLVQNQQDSALVAEPAQAGKVLRAGNVHAPLALNRLDQHCGGLVVKNPGDSLEVVVRHVHEPRHHRLEPQVVLGLGSCRQCGESPAVEASFHRDNLVSAMDMSMSPRQLDRRLVGLGAAVAEEALAGVEMRTDRPLRKCLGKRSLRFHVPGIGHVDELPDLFPNRGDDPGRAMA